MRKLKKMVSGLNLRKPPPTPRDNENSPSRTELPFTPASPRTPGYRTIRPRGPPDPFTPSPAFSGTQYLLYEEFSSSPSNMAEQEEDFSSLPLTDRFVHKQWKVRKQAYEDAAKEFEKSPDEHAPVFRPFVSDSGLWKGAAGDSNVAAQQEGIAALCAFLKFGSRDGAVRARSQAVTPIVEKGLSSTRAATKTSALEALLLFIEADVANPTIEDMLPSLAAKQPKVVAATLAALTAIFHNYGCKVADPKPVLKALPKAFGHADKNVRAEATNLAVELYRWLREAMKPMFWGDLKPTQQTDLEAQFQKVVAEAPPKQERLLRSQQEAQARAPAGGAEDEYDDGGDMGDEPAEIDAFDLAEPQEVLKSVPANFYDNLASSKWKDRKEALEALFAIINVPRIKDGDYNEINRGLAKCMKDANIAVVTQAAQCIEVLARGLRKAYGKYRSVVMQPIMERLKEKKVTVADALGAALDQVFLATSLTECLEDTLAFLVHKNPQVKEGTMKFLIRCLRTTSDVPAKAEIGGIVEAGKKLLAESSEVLRSGGAEVLGTVMKIIGDRAMGQHLEGLDEIRVKKIKEFFETAEVKAKDKPKPKPAPAPAARAPGGPPKKVMGGGVKKGPAGLKKPVGAAAPPPPPKDEPLAPIPTSRAPVAGKLGMPKPSGLGGLKAPRGRLAGPGAASPRRMVAPSPTFDDEPAPPPTPQPRFGMGRGGLAGRSLAKPSAAAPPMAPPSPTPASGLTAIERAELEELRAANDRLIHQSEEFRHERSKLFSEIQELKNSNATLIEDHTRDVLSIKAKETQLVRARSDCEAAEQTNERLRRELDRLKRALNKAEAAGVRSPSAASASPGFTSPTHDDAGIYRDAYPSSAGRNRMSYQSTMSEEKENGEPPPPYRGSKVTPEMRYGQNGGASGRDSPAAGRFRRDPRPPSRVDNGDNGVADAPPAAGGSGGQDQSWRRAAEVTSQLKARIEQMKARQNLNRG